MCAMYLQKLDNNVTKINSYTFIYQGQSEHLLNICTLSSRNGGFFFAASFRTLNLLFIFFTVFAL